MGNEEFFIHSYLICSGNEEGRWRKAEKIGLSALLGGKQGALKRPFSNHPDVLLVEPDLESKSLAITISQIRELEKKLNLKPYMAASKVVIVKEAQRMTREAQNALLKTLEEPPAHSVLILTVLQANLLLPTIVSRCQKVVLKPHIEIDIKSQTHQIAVEEFSKILGMSMGERLSWVEDNKSLVGNSHSVVELLNSWISVLRDLILKREDLEKQMLNRNLGDELWRLVEAVRLPRLLEGVIEIRHVLSTININPRLAVEIFLLEL